jgi:hypothetical protein
MTSARSVRTEHAQKLDDEVPFPRLLMHFSATDTSPLWYASWVCVLRKLANAMVREPLRCSCDAKDFKAGSWWHVSQPWMVLRLPTEAAIPYATMLFILPQAHNGFFRFPWVSSHKTFRRYLGWCFHYDTISAPVLNYALRIQEVQGVYVYICSAAQWFWHYAISRKVAGSRIGGVNFFNLRNPSGRTRPWGFTQPLTNKSKKKRKMFVGSRAWPVRGTYNLTAIREPVVWTTWDLQHLTALKTARPVTGIKKN